VVITIRSRIADVLRDREDLIDVFVSVSPAFSRLRNTAVRRVMARLVTVEQAAGIAGVDPQLLLERLNQATSAGGSSSRSADANSEATGAARPISSAARPVCDGDETAGEAGAIGARSPRKPAGPVVELDVRDDLRAGREPFSRIMSAVGQVPEGGALRLHAIFEPVPLYAVLARRGFTHRTTRISSEHWEVLFSRPGAPIATSEQGEVADRPFTSAAEDGASVIDVRGLEPPEPLVRTLAAVERMEPGAALVQLNVRIPLHLLPRLEALGLEYEIDESEVGVVRTTIHRPMIPASAAHRAKPTYTEDEDER
jgi:uncharacterized protein (DUF2249 family)